MDPEALAAGLLGNQALAAGPLGSGVGGGERLGLAQAPNCQAALWQAPNCQAAQRQAPNCTKHLIAQQAPSSHNRLIAKVCNQVNAKYFCSKKPQDRKSTRLNSSH